MYYADLHTHILYGVDDGARSAEEMRSLLDAEYADGVRVICFTPHMRPEIWGDTSERCLAVFEEARQYAGQKYPDLKLCLGNEIRYHHNCLQWLRDGRCRTLGGSRNLLLELPDDVTGDASQDACLRILQAGYVPVIAHIERCARIRRNRKLLDRLKRYGCLLQMDAEAVLPGAPLAMRMAAGSLLSHRMIDIVASDCHDPEHRRPNLAESSGVIADKYGSEYAELIFLKNQCRIIERNNKGDTVQ